MPGYPHFSFWIPITLAKIYSFPIVIAFAKIHLYYEAPSLSNLFRHADDYTLIDYWATQARESRQLLRKYALTIYTYLVNPERVCWSDNNKDKMCWNKRQNKKKKGKKQE